MNSHRHFAVYLVLSCFTLPIPQAFAEIACTERGLRPGYLVCENRFNNHTTIVSFRYIEPWGDNAGMTLIDICDTTTPFVGETHESGGIKYISNNDPNKQKYLDNKCQRRYCSQDQESFLLAIGPVPILIEPMSFGMLSIGFAYAHFEVRCEEIK